MSNDSSTSQNKLIMKHRQITHTSASQNSLGKYQNLKELQLLIQDQKEDYNNKL